MMAVALTAVLSAGTCRGIKSRSRARFHQCEAEKVQDLFDYLAFSPAPAGLQQPPPPDVAEREISLWHAFRAYHERMKVKSEHAARRPWAFEEADPPPPDEPATLKAILLQTGTDLDTRYK
jgi:hypothetical protein